MSVSRTFPSRKRSSLLPTLLLALALAAPIAPVAAADPVTVAEFRLPAQDQAGWSVFKPAADSRLIYVDASRGDDATGVIYLPGDPAIGNNPQAPAGTVRAFRTLAAAAAGLREDQPDWLLLRAGGVWNESLQIKRGRSPDERTVVIPYGTGARPELRTGTSKAISNVQMTNAAIVGIRFWAHTRDTDGPHFRGYDGSAGIGVYTRTAGDRRQVRDVLIEDCVFRSYSNNVLTGSRSGNNEPISRFVIRRSIFSGNYSDSGHAQGIYHAGGGQPVQPSLLLQENLFDHNGWRIQSREGNNAKPEGQATMFNHNTYLTSANGVIFQRNLFLRSSSIGNKWTGSTENPSRAVVMDNNLYAEGEIGISIGGNWEGRNRFQDVVIRNNVITDIGRTRPTNRSLAWGIEAKDWQGGLIAGNLLVHQRTSIGNAWGLVVSAATGAEDVRIVGNVFANLAASASHPTVQLRDGGNTSSIVFERNTIQTPASNAAIALSTGGYSFLGTNRYASPSTQPFRLNGNSVDLAGWRSATGDRNATTAAPSFPDPSRDLERYAQRVGVGDSFEDLVEALHGQSKANWNPQLTAAAINDWLRAGFGQQAVGANDN